MSSPFFQDSGFRFAMEAWTRSLLLPRLQATFHIFIWYLLFVFMIFSLTLHTLYGSLFICLLSYFSSWYFLSHILTFHILYCSKILKFFSPIAYFAMRESDYLFDNLGFRSLSQTKRKKIYIFFSFLSLFFCHVCFWPYFVIGFCNTRLVLGERNHCHAISLEELLHWLAMVL
jgi:hypothetical protein